jgi:hypothetical protein
MVVEGLIENEKIKSNDQMKFLPSCNVVAVIGGDEFS